MKLFISSYLAVTITMLIIAVCPTILLAGNSEEHKILVDEAVALVIIDPSVIQMIAPTGFVNLSEYADLTKFAKNLAVGFDTNNPAHYNPDKLEVQDNSYWTVSPNQWGQIDFNMQIWIPDASVNPNKVLLVKSIAGSINDRWFTMGELAAFYGDYRRTTYFDANLECHVTSADWVYDPPYQTTTTRPFNTVEFREGKDCFPWPFDCGYRPLPHSPHLYLRAIASGLVPPYGRWGNVGGNTAWDTEWDEAGWWGDEMLRIATVNDWHFSNGALAWYVGLHRLALKYVQLAITDPKYWDIALHYEANALHSLTDLFAFGHVVTNRDITSYNIMDDKNLLGASAFIWMENVIKMGGGERSSDPSVYGYPGKIELLPNLPAISDVTSVKNDFMRSYAGSWAPYAKQEKDFHDEFNNSGAVVRNLKGNQFQIYGDGEYSYYVYIDPNSRSQMVGAVRSSVQSLFDAYVAMINGATVEQIGSTGSPFFEALKYIPIFIESDPEHHFIGMYTSYAGAADEISGTNLLPTNWDGCKIQYVWGSLSELDVQPYACTTFPVVTNIDELSSSLPVVFSLSQNYPNPFNPTTNIKYSIPVADNVSIKVLDMLGREVAVLVNEYKNPGLHSINFDGSRFSSGVYFYLIQAGSFVETKKMVLMK